MPEDTQDETKMPLLDHLVELRSRLIWAVVGFIMCFFLAFYFAEYIFAFLVQPLAEEMGSRQGARMIYTALHEAFFTYVKVAFFTAAFVAFPLIASQIWLFVAPGLYKNEKKAFLPFLIATPVLFFLGGALVYYLIFPMAWEFFLNFQTSGENGALPIQVEPKVGEYLSLVMQLIFAFGLGFELPVLLLLLVKARILSAEALAEKRRYAIVGVFIFAAVLTPPDIISQIGLAIPIILLYEVSIYGARIIEKKREETGREGEEDLSNLKEDD